MSAGLPYERMFEIEADEDPFVFPLPVPYRGDVRRLVVKQIQGAQAFTADLLTAHPDDMEFEEELYRIVPQQTAQSGLVALYGSAYPYLSQEVAADTAARRASVVYLQLSDFGDDVNFQVGIEIDTPNSRS